MNKLIGFLLGIALVSPAYGAKVPSVAGEDGSEINALKNPGFENGKAGWTASGGSFTISNSTDLKFGKFTGVFDASAASQCLTSDPVSMTSGEWKGLAGMNGFAYFHTSTAANDYVVSIWDGTKDISVRTIANTSGQSLQGISFVYPATGTVALRICSQSNASKITLENSKLGLNNVAQVGSAEIVGTLNMSGYYQTSSASFVDMAKAGGSEPVATGKCSFGTASSTELVCPNLAPGKYVVSVIGGSLQNGGGAGGGAAMKITDGTNSSAIVNVVTQNDVGYRIAPAAIEWQFDLTSAASKTFELQMLAVTTGTATYSSDGAQIVVKRFTDPTEQAVRMDTVASNWSGFLYGANWSTTSGSYVVPSYNGPSVGLAVSDASGISCVENASNPELTCTVPALGKYEACLQGSLGVTTASEIGELRLKADGNEIAETAVYGSTNTQGVPFNACGVFTPTALSFVLATEMKVSSGATAVIQYGNTPLRFTLKPMSQQVPAPLIVGGVVSSSAGVMRVEQATLGSSGNVISEGGGDWISGNAAHPGTGEFAITFVPGLFSSTIAPYCFFTIIDSGSADGTVNITSASTTSIAYKTRWVGALTDIAHTVFCIGPK